MRALEQLRVEHQEAIHREQNEVDRERRQAQEREQTLTDAFELEKYNLQGQLEAVTAELRSLQEEVDSEDDPSIDDEAEVRHTTPLERAEPSSTPHMERGTDPIRRTEDRGTERGTERTRGTERRTEDRGTEDRGTEGSTDRGTERTTDRRTETDTRRTEPPGGEERLLPPAGRESPSESLLVATMTRLLEAHTEAIAAQTQATAAQHLPPLKAFTGEGKQMEEDGFERWIEQFEERAKVAGWSTEQKLHQIKLLLEKTALRVLRALPDTDQSQYQKVVDALRARFKAVDIEELRGMEFHHKVQRDESIDRIGASSTRAQSVPINSRPRV